MKACLLLILCVFTVHSKFCFFSGNNYIEWSNTTSNHIQILTKLEGYGVLFLTFKVASKVGALFHSPKMFPSLVPPLFLSFFNIKTFFTTSDSPLITFQTLTVLLRSQFFIGTMDMINCLIYTKATRMFLLT
jgi:hypothetical protein